jgi:hypothetical protein
MTYLIFSFYSITIQVILQKTEDQNFQEKGKTNFFVNPRLGEKFQTGGRNLVM